MVSVASVGQNFDDTDSFLCTILRCPEIEFSIEDRYRTYGSATNNCIANVISATKTHLNHNFFILQANMPRFDAATTAEVDGFIMKLSHLADGPIITGNLARCTKEAISIKVLEGMEEVIANRDLLFNIQFHINRLSFQFRHNALKWIDDHNLFLILIK